MAQGDSVKIRHGYERRLTLTADQTMALDMQGHAARALWNLLHEWWQWGGRTRRPTLRQADEAIRQARAEISWLTDLPAQAAQQVLKTYVKAWRNFFQGRARPPKFKGRLRSRMAVDAPQASGLRIKRLSRHCGEFRVTKVGIVRFRWSGPLPGVGREPGRITGARLLKDALGWHVVFRTEVNAVDPIPHPGPVVGVDRGVAVALALSDGSDYVRGPWLRPKESVRLLRLERKAARQKRGRQPFQPVSHRLRRTYDQIAGLRARTTHRRLDWQHKSTTTLAERYGTVVVEDLRLTNMIRSAKGTAEKPGKNVRQKAGLNRVMLGEAHGRTVELLAYKLTERGGMLIKVPAPGTSLTCSMCGHRDPASRSIISFSCISCGWVGHADTNAAVNILNAAGLAVYGRGDDVHKRRGEASTIWEAA